MHISLLMWSGKSGKSDLLGTASVSASPQTQIRNCWPEIRRSILNEDEYGFRRAKGPIYYDEGLERTSQTLNAKISQLNSAIDNVSSRLRGGIKLVKESKKTDSEIEAAM